MRVWDTRQPAAPATAFLPAAASTAAPECWCVALGNAYGKDGQHRCVLAGYANGDVRMFDLRAARLRWETNVGKGVCGMQVRCCAVLCCCRGDAGRRWMSPPESSCTFSLPLALHSLTHNATPPAPPNTSLTAATSP